MFLRTECRKYLSLFVIATYLISCGRESNSVHPPTISTEQAVNDLNMLASEALPEQGRKRNETLRGVLEDLISSGTISVKSTQKREAVNRKESSESALESLDKILKIFSDGQVTNLFSVATQLLESSKDDASKIRIDLALVVQLLNAALPVLTSVAPQFVPIVQALTTVLPLIDSIIKLFQKPKPSVTPRPLPSPVQSPIPKPTVTPRPSPTAVPSPSPRPSPSPSPSPAPIGFLGQALYEGKCAGCHALGSFDGTGSPNLSGKGSAVQGKFTAGVSSHMGITLSAGEISSLIQFVNSH